MQCVDGYHLCLTAFGWYWKVYFASFLPAEASSAAVLHKDDDDDDDDDDRDYDDDN